MLAEITSSLTGREAPLRHRTAIFWQHREFRSYAGRAQRLPYHSLCTVERKKRDRA